jgi:hypothetical protein
MVVRPPAAAVSTATEGMDKGGGHNNSRAGGNAGCSAYNPNTYKNCGKKGNWATDCRSKPKEHQAHVD